MWSVTVPGGCVPGARLCIPAAAPNLIPKHAPEPWEDPMRTIRRPLLSLFFCALCSSSALAQQAMSGNPIIPGWYADPEAHVFAAQYWIFPTYSAPYSKQTFMDAFSSSDLITWQKHSSIIDTANVKWAHRAMWAPSIVHKDGYYYLFFGANDIQNDSAVGGIGVARSRTPDGPFEDYLGKPLIDKFHNGAQPIDQMVFQDVDGRYYIIYGGWGHCNIARLNATFTGFVPFPDGTTFKEITPKGYVEGSYMFVKDGRYYFMWSEGGWTGPDYAVAYAIGKTPFGPFERVGKILQQDSTVATGAGHHSVIHNSASNKWYIVYHRRPLGETDRNHRVVSIDEMKFDKNGFILPVVITKTGVSADPLPLNHGR
jgi:beta-xylosidase